MVLFALALRFFVAGALVLALPASVAAELACGRLLSASAAELMTDGACCRGAGIVSFGVAISTETMRETRSTSMARRPSCCQSAPINSCRGRARSHSRLRVGLAPSLVRRIGTEIPRRASWQAPE
jgi:hypothetical protein